MINGYDKKMLRIYFNKITEALRLIKWNLWQKLNRNLLKTYPLIEDCARCRDCGRNVHDFRVPDKLWMMVMETENGVWCYDCFCDHADKKGLQGRMKLEFKWH